jgi:alcohol dehydrogenase class IV
VTAANIRALRERSPENPALGRYAEVSRWISVDASRTPEALIEDLNGLVTRLGIPRLSHWGVSATGLEDLVRKAQESSSMKGNPIRLTDMELLGVLASAL